MNIRYIILTFIIVISHHFGNAQVVVGESKPIEFLMLPVSDEDLPPELFLHIAFVDENGNGILEATEKSELIATFYNCGAGRAQDITIQLEMLTSDTDLSIEKRSHVIPALFPNGVTSISFPINAGKAVRNMEHKMNIRITEKNGHNFEVVKFSFHTQSAASAKLEFVGLEIIDFGEETISVETDGRIQAGERVILKIHVQNTDKGIAKGVNYNVYSRNRGLVITEGEGYIGHMGFGDVVNFTVWLRVAKSYTDMSGRLPLYLNMTLSEGVGGFTSLQLPIEMEKPSQGVNIKNLGRDLETYISKFATFEYTSNRINSRVGKYLPPLFTSNIINATTRGNGGGYIVPSEYKVTARGVCWATTPNPTLENNHTIDGSGPGPFNSLITGLNASTTYYARAYATYEEGIVFGNQISFTTLELPVLTTSSVSNVTATTALSGGNITFDGGSPIIERGVCWGLSPNPTVTSNKMSSGAGTGSFTTRITMLNANTTYYIRAYAVNAAGAAYGEQLTLRTKKACDGIEFFVYEEQNYNTIEVGNQCWMKENLNAGVYIKNVPHTEEHSEAKKNNIIEKYCYDNNQNNCVLYGGLYDWNEMMLYRTNEGIKGVCPEGFHLPTLAEWNTLISFFGGETVAGTPVKKGGASGFEVLAGGMRSGNGNFTLLGSGAYFWTSTLIDEGNAWSISLLFRGTSLVPTSRNKNSGLSIRCIKD